MKQKTDEREWLRSLLKELPDKASPETVRFAESNREIRPALMIFARESVPEREFDNFMEAGLYDPADDRFHWGARCRCTDCDYEFTAGWRDGKALVLTMEDGTTLEGWNRGDDYESAVYGEGDEIYCPSCGERCNMVKRSRIRGRSFVTRIAELTNVGSTTVILYWLAYRWLDKGGFSAVRVYPERAAAISPNGKIFCFQRVGGGIAEGYSWATLSKADEQEEKAFFCGGGCYEFGCGAWYFFNAGDMTGTTGEKTAVDLWFRSEKTSQAVTYLKEWRRHPALEALVKTGGANLVNDFLKSKAAHQECGALNFRERKPHRMLGLTREEYRIVIENHWSLDLIRDYQAYKTLFPKTAIQQFNEWKEILGKGLVSNFRGYFRDGMGRICSYMEKQTENGCPDAEGYYLDYRRALDRIRRESGLDGEPVQEEKFPRDLMEAHNRVMEAQAAILRERRRKGSKEEIGTFAKLKKELGMLEWKQGEYCILIPEKPEDLVIEGETLHHCVGGYASQHCSGKMIFFVRHARRPERSWYTLNENVNGNSVERIQLHGYRNEWVGNRKLQIPKEVLDFVQEWENTVLSPYLKNKSGRKTA